VGVPSSDVWHVAVADYDRDGRPEIACGGRSDSIDIVYWSGGTWAVRTVALPAGVTGTGSIGAGDFNGDGRPDLVFGSDARELAVALNEGAGVFPGSSISTTPIAGYAMDLEVADLERDGRADVVVNSQKPAKIVVLKGNGAGRFVRELGMDSTQSEDFALGDFNADGAPDLAQWVPEEATICVWPGDGAGFFNAPYYTQANASGDSGFASADFDGDGFADLAASDWDGAVEVFRGWDRSSNVTFTGLAAGTWYFHVREVGTGAGARVSTIRINVSALGERIRNVHFRSNSSTLTPSTRAALRRLAATIKARGYNTITAEGWTAHRDKGSSSFRRRLSAARARAVKTYLDSRLRVLHAKARVVAVGKGAVPGSRFTTSLDRKVVIWAK
jgi:hypothetical protein